MPAIKFTARFVDTVKSGAPRTDHRDSLVKGLELRVTEHGSKTWAVRYTRKSDGRRRRVTIGTYPATGLENARIDAREKLAAVARGADPASKVQERKEALTFREITEEWTKRHGQPNKGYRSLKDDQCMLTRHILPEIGDMRASEITKRDVIRLLDVVAAAPDARVKRASGVARRMTHRPNRVFELTRSIFRWAIGRDILKIDPTLGLPSPLRKPKPRARVLSAAEIATLWCVLGEAPTKLTKTYDDHLPMDVATALTLKLALATAQRIGEVVGIARCEYSLAGAEPVWTVPAERSKNGESNRVPLSPFAAELIREAEKLAGQSQWLFPHRRGKGPIDAHAPCKTLCRARSKIGLNNFRIHDLRRTAATHMAALGISPHTISLVLNHISARKGTVTGAVYVQYSYDKEKRAALETWGAHLNLIVANIDAKNVVALPIGRLSGSDINLSDQTTAA